MHTGEATSSFCSTMDVPEIITCVDCGQKAHRLTLPPEDGWEIGDIVAYRCSGCNDRWDLVVEDSDAPQATSPHDIDIQRFLEERRSK